jgi:hypothetical protein
MKSKAAALPRPGQIKAKVNKIWNRPPLPAETRARLDAEAALHAKERAQRSLPFNRMKLIHLTNTPGEMSGALNDPKADAIEGDLRLERLGAAAKHPISIIMAHDLDLAARGLKFDDWYQFGLAANLKLKLDFSKDRRTFMPALKALQKAKVSGKDLLLNVHVVSVPKNLKISIPQRVYNALVGTTVPMSEVLEARKMFPDAVIALGMTKYPGQKAYTDDQVRSLMERAKTVPGQLMFPIQADLATPELISKLATLGKVAIWNDLGSPPKVPDEAAAEVLAEQFRKQGVEGIIDLRPTK